MRKVYLRIHYGCDDRFNMVSRTIRVSAPYFHQIRVTNFGPDQNTEKFAGLLAEFPNLQVVNLGKHYHMCITEDLLRHHYMDVPEGEWVAWLDSDWRFPPYFLEHMQEEIDNCEKNNFNHLFSVQRGHYFKNPDGTYEEYTQEVIDRMMIELEAHVAKGWEVSGNTYGWPILQKVNKANIWTNGFLGNHSYSLHVPYNKNIVPRMYHLHMRDFSDHAYCSTMAHQSWWYIGHNVFPLNEHQGIYNSWEYNMLENFKLKHRCFTSNHFHEMKKDPAFLEKLRELFLHFKDSGIFGCQQMYRLANQYNMVFLGANPSDLPCNGVCCQYKCGRLIDLPI